MDLFFRLNVLDLTIPPLRDREGDAEYLFGHYLAVYAARRGMPAPRPSRGFLRSLGRAPWAGNVRELENLAEKYVTLAHIHAETAFAPREGGEAGEPGAGAVPFEPPLDLAAWTTAPDGRESVPEEAESLEEGVRRLVRLALDREGGNITRAARRLAVSRNTVKRWLGGKGGETVKF